MLMIMGSLTLTIGYEKLDFGHLIQRDMESNLPFCCCLIMIFFLHSLAAARKILLFPDKYEFPPTQVYVCEGRVEGVGKEGEKGCGKVNGSILP